MQLGKQFSFLAFVCQYNPNGNKQFIIAVTGINQLMNEDNPSIDAGIMKDILLM